MAIEAPAGSSDEAEARREELEKLSDRRSSLDSEENEDSTPVTSPSNLSPKRHVQAAPSERSSSAGARVTILPTTDIGSNERSAVVMALFGPSVGPCLGDFSTTYNRVNGRLYASVRAVLFYSNLFGFERRLCLQLSDVTDIEAFRSTSIRVSTVDCEEYIFKKFQDRDHVLSILLGIFVRFDQQLQKQKPSQPEQYYEDGPSVPTESKDPRVGNGVNQTVADTTSSETRPGRRQSLGDRVGGLLRGVTSFGDFSDQERGQPSIQPFAQRGNSQTTGMESQVESPRPHLSSDLVETIGPHTDSKDTELISPRRRSRSVPILQIPKSDDAVFPRRHMDRTECTRRQDDRENVSVPTESKHNFDYRPKDTTTIGDARGGPSLAVVKAAWDEVRQPLEETHIKDVTLQCSLDTCFDLFFADEAPHSVDKYQREEIGDFDIVVTPWSEIDATHQMARSRKIQFVHPLKNAMGPSKANTTRKQRIHRCGNLGMCWENETTIEGIPAADCFRIEDRWVFEPCSPRADGEGDSNLSATPSSQIKLSVTFRIVFFKRTMLRSLIQKNVRQENRSWVQGYVSMVEKTLAERGETFGRDTSRLQHPQLNNDMDSVTSKINPFEQGEGKLVSNETSTYLATSTSSQSTKAVGTLRGSHIVLLTLVAVGVTMFLLVQILQLLWMRQTMTLWQSEMELLREQNQQLLSVITTLAQKQQQQECQNPPSNSAY